MSTNTDRDALRAALRSWGNRRRALEAERDPLVRRSLEAGISKEEIHKATDLGRTTIDRIQDAAKEG
jgi:DNA invertase Pin-like site-specific DNA recombinase